jgi:primary-amine oxidase
VNTRTNVSSDTILALGVSVKFDLTGRNWENWKAVGWYTHGEFYASTDEFRAAINSTDFVKPPAIAIVDGNWTSTDRQGPPLPLDDQPPPVSVSQGPQRFKIDAEEGYVSWMDFTFYHSVSHDIGLSLHNIQYKGTRLIYELSLQEALTAYAGDDPFASQATFIDTGTGMGSTLQPLVRGYDCPSYATYLPATWTEGNATKTVADAICLFEFDTGYPIRRHSFWPSAPHTSVAKNIQLTMRTIATVGNYDFMIEYNFFYDGAIEVSARASGYISAAFWAQDPEYGFHIHDFLSGSIHDHTLTFKADFDIFGTKNSVQKVEFVPISTTYPWSQGRIHNTFKASRSFLSNESSSSINWAENDAINYAIVNADTPNRFGEYPGYRIKKAAGTIHLTQSNLTDIQKAGAFATHDLYITQQKDREVRASDAWNQFVVEDPLVDFATFLDDESLEQEDLYVPFPRLSYLLSVSAFRQSIMRTQLTPGSVLWFNLGMHHLPHTGDLPNTMFTSAHSAIRFEPLNYLEGDPSVQSNQQIRIDYDEEGAISNVEEFGKIVGNVSCH